jgi:parallel beta-helix repeat protein
MSLREAFLAFGLAVSATPVLAGDGAPACPDRAPDPITAPTAAGEKCQQAIAKEGAKFLKSKTSTLSKCLLKSAPGTCPTAADTAKIEQAAQKSTDKIAKACGDDAAQAGLSTSYNTLTDDAAISSCMLSQHNAISQLLVLNATGISTEDWPGPGTDNKARAKCVSQVAKTGVAIGLDILAAQNKCIANQIKQGVAGDLGPICVGSIASGNVVLPSDAKTADKVGKILSSAESNIQKKCGAGEGSWLPTVFACDGAATSAELFACLRCRGYQGAVSFVEQQYGERGTLVENGPDAIQTAVDAATPGTKLLIEPGDYPDSTTVLAGDLQFVGCGGATNDRPRIAKSPTCVDPDCNRGIFASNGVDDLLFQSLEVDDWDGDGIFVSGVPAAPPVEADPAERIVFRDIIGDGGDQGDTSASRYAVFPVHSADVLIEGCDVRDISDAGIYIGQSDELVLRFNRIERSVAGIEFENSAHGVAHNNFATGNTAGHLVFLDGSLPVQFSSDHRVAHNVYVDNNGVNYGGGNVAGVPVGTGMLLISDDNSVYEYNILTGNDSFGIALTDQVIAEFNISPDPEDIRATGATIRNNVITGNGGNPDTEAILASDIVMALAANFPPGTPLYGSPPVHNNCITDNLVDQDPAILGESQCP